MVKQLVKSKIQLENYFVALIAGLGGILYGYDIGVISGALLFIRKIIPMTDSQIGIVVGAVLGGSLIGTIMAGFLADNWGRRKTIALSGFIFIVGVFFILFSNSFLGIVIARCLLGVGVGIVAVAVPLYITELVVPAARGRCVTFFQLMLTIGILLAYLVDLAFTPSGNWRAMFGVVLIPAIILILGIARLPESPRWLAEKNRHKEARQVLLQSRSSAEADEELKAIERGLKETKTSWAEFKSPQLYMPLFIAISIAILNQLTGINSFLQYAPHILQVSGISSARVEMLGSVGIGFLNFICTAIAILLVDKVGRRPLLIVGVAGVIFSEVYLGFVNYLTFPPHLTGLLSLLGLFLFIIFFAIGPGVVVWLAISELFPTRMRSKGISACLFFNSLTSTILASVFLNLKTSLGMYGTYWLFAFFSLFYLLIVVFFLPETKAKTLEEIQHDFLVH